MNRVTPGSTSFLKLVPRVGGQIPEVAPTLSTVTLLDPDGAEISLSAAPEEWDAENGWFLQVVEPADIEEALAWTTLSLRWTWAYEGSTKKQYERVEVSLIDEEYYGSVSQVQIIAGLDPDDLGLTDDLAIGSVLSDWLLQATDFIDTETGTHYDPALVPAGIENIANRIAANMAVLAVQRRTSPIVQVGDFSVSMLEDKVINAAIREDLKAYISDPRADQVRPKFAIGASNRLTREQDVPLDKVETGTSIDMNEFFA